MTSKFLPPERGAVPATKPGDLLPEGLAERDRLLPHIRGPHAQDLEVRKHCLNGLIEALRDIILFKDAVAHGFNI